jgi:hypothetical protein
MSFFDRLFGKKAPPPSSDKVIEPTIPRPVDKPAPATPTPRPPIEGPPEFVRAVELHRAYWTYNAQELWLLESRGLEQLSWRERLRLHHLACMERLGGDTEHMPSTDKRKLTTPRLLAADSPYRPRAAMIWRAQAAERVGQKMPDMQGLFLNASLTHLGCLEIYRVDADNQPTSIDFVSFDELSGILFAPAKVIRSAKLFFEDGRNEVVLTPLLYGSTWEFGNDNDRAGRMTRFVGYLEGDEIGAVGAAGVGIGQQDFTVRNPDGSASLFGVGSVSEIAFPLDVRDPRFDQKARARGIDPDAIRKQISK